VAQAVHLAVEKSSPKIWPIFVIFKKRIKKTTIAQKGENSSNLVTLLEVDLFAADIGQKNRHHFRNKKNAIADLTFFLLATL
jgi:hypothetical protein